VVVLKYSCDVEKDPVLSTILAMLAEVEVM
jgi:hypothetical protein